MDNSSINVDTCKHRIIYDQEWVCCKCGRVFNEEEVEELQRGSIEVTAIKSLESIGLDPHGKTPLWLHGLGSIEGYKHEKDQGSREDISIISNIADKLQLPSYAAQEFLILYRSFVKERKDRVLAAKTAIFIIDERYPEVKQRIYSLSREEGVVSKSDHEYVDYILTVVNMQFNIKDHNNNNNDLSKLELLPIDVPRLAKRFGASKTFKLLIIKQRWRKK
ncbi:MAG: hypothetical protein QXJ44_06065 [Candidatus Nitrosocaldus sp.]